jgi:DUF971 family protein
MAGLDKNIPIPSEIKLNKASRTLELGYEDGTRFEFTHEFLRVHSPSAEVQGHGPGQEVLQVGKKNVEITGVEPVGHYAVKLVFSDGHDSGLYSWDYFLHLGKNRDALWQDYLRRMEEAGASRETGPDFRPKIVHMKT